VNLIKRILLFIKAGGVFLGMIVGVLASSDDPETSDRPQGDGSDLFGDYNFRTERFDAGTDPNGWYEEDM
jgi:hypothetical protein